MTIGWMQDLTKDMLKKLRKILPRRASGEWFRLFLFIFILLNIADRLRSADGICSATRRRCNFTKIAMILAQQQRSCKPTSEKVNRSIIEQALIRLSSVKSCYLRNAEENNELANSTLYYHLR